jgi:hypothetical protein
MGERTRIDATNTSCLVQIHGRAHGGTVVHGQICLGSYDGLPVRSPERVSSSSALIQSALPLAAPYPVTNMPANGWPCVSRQTEKVQGTGSRTAPRPGFSSGAAPSWAQTLLEGLGRKAIARRASIRLSDFVLLFDTIWPDADTTRSASSSQVRLREPALEHCTLLVGCASA